MKVTILGTIQNFSGGQLTLESVKLLLSISQSAALLSQEVLKGDDATYVLDDPENEQMSAPVQLRSDGTGSTFRVFAYRNRFVTVHHWSGATVAEAAIAVAHAVLSQERLFADMQSDIQRFLRSPKETATAREWIPDEVVREVWRRCQMRCVKCSSNERLEVDHIIPLAKGGSNTVRNLQLLCEECNRSKGAMI